MSDELIDGMEVAWWEISGKTAPGVGESLPAAQVRDREPLSVIQRFVEVFR